MPFQDIPEGTTHHESDSCNGGKGHPPIESEGMDKHRREALALAKFFDWDENSEQVCSITEALSAAHARGNVEGREGGIMEAREVVDSMNKTRWSIVLTEAVAAITNLLEGEGRV